MLTHLFAWLKVNKVLDLKIAEFNNNISLSGNLFKNAITLYLKEGNSLEFENLFLKVKKYEGSNDKLRREIETTLFLHTLIPESRGDVLVIIESLDKIINKYEKILQDFIIEKPVIPIDIKKLFLDLTDSVCQASGLLIKAANSFFINITEVQNNCSDILFYIRESNKISSNLKQVIFENERIELIHKSQIGSFVDSIKMIADLSKHTADKLINFTIKRVA